MVVLLVVDWYYSAGNLSMTIWSNSDFGYGLGVRGLVGVLVVWETTVVQCTTAAVFCVFILNVNQYLFHSLLWNLSV
jgi:hypothetical protein